MKARVIGVLFAWLVGLLIRRGLTPEQAEVAARQMTDTPLRAAWRYFRK